MILTPTPSPHSSPTPRRRSSEENSRPVDDDEIQILGQKSKSVTPVITTHETTTDYWVRHTVGRASCVGQTVVYGLGVLFQTAKIIIKAPISLIAEGAAKLFDTKIFDDFAFVGMKKDARHLEHLFTNKFIEVVSWDNLLPPVGYCSLWNAFISTTKVVALGENEVDVLEKKEKIRHEKTQKIEKIHNVVVYCISRLRELNAVNTEGLFRISGNSERIAEFRVDFKFDKNGDLTLDDEGIDEHVITGTLKQILRDMDSGLLDSVKDELLQINEINYIVPQLKDIINEIQDKREKEILQMLIEFLGEVAANSEVNKMNYSSLAMMIMPNLVKYKDIHEESATYNRFNKIFAAMIEHRDEIFN